MREQLERGYFRCTRWQGYWYRIHYPCPSGDSGKGHNESARLKPGPQLIRAACENPAHGESPQS